MGVGVLPDISTFLLLPILFLSPKRNSFQWPKGSSLSCLLFEDVSFELWIHRQELNI